MVGLGGVLGLGINSVLGGVGKALENGGIAFDQLAEALVGADGGFEDDFLGEQEGGAAVDDGAVLVPEHLVEGEVGHRGGFAGLTFPEQGPQTRLVFNKSGERHLLISAAGWIFGRVHSCQYLHARFIAGSHLRSFDSQHV